MYQKKGTPKTGGVLLVSQKPGIPANHCQNSKARVRQTGPSMIVVKAVCPGVPWIAHETWSGKNTSGSV